MCWPALPQIQHEIIWLVETVGRSVTCGYSREHKQSQLVISFWQRQSKYDANAKAVTGR